MTTYDNRFGFYDSGKKYEFLQHSDAPPWTTHNARSWIRYLSTDGGETYTYSN